MIFNSKNKEIKHIIFLFNVIYYYIKKFLPIGAIIMSYINWFFFLITEKFHDE